MRTFAASGDRRSDGRPTAPLERQVKLRDCRPIPIVAEERCRHGSRGSSPASRHAHNRGFQPTGRVPSWRLEYTYIYIWGAHSAQ